MNVGIVGATGYAGQQLCHILSKHPEVTIKFLVSNSYSGESFNSLYPHYGDDMSIPCISVETLENSDYDLDFLFLAMPHGKSMKIAEGYLNSGIKVIDLGADFRLDDVGVFESWYKTRHISPSLCKSAVYGLPEINKKAIQKAHLIANPGCYPTASILALAPVVQSDLALPTPLIIDAKSGISGAGRSAKTQTLYCESAENLKAYAVTDHRHSPEIEQGLNNLTIHSDPRVLFTPHLIPMSRGILTTCYVQLKDHISQEDLLKLYQDFYKHAPFVRISSKLPETKWVTHSNYCDISVRVDERTNTLIAIAAIDNLIKGAAGQAVQNFNLMAGFEETLGLNMTPFIP